MKNMKKDRIVLGALSCVTLGAFTVGITNTFAWYQASTPSVSVAATSASISVAQPELMLQVTQINPWGYTTDSATNTPNGTAGFSITDSRALTDVSGVGSSLYKATFREVYSPGTINSGYANVVDVSNKTDYFSNANGSYAHAYAYVRFGFKVVNTSTSSADVRAYARLTESLSDITRSASSSSSEATGKGVARVQIAEITGANDSTCQTITGSSWTERAYLDYDGDSIKPIVRTLSYTEEQIAASTASTFSTCLAASYKAATDVSDSTVITIKSSLAASASAYFAVTIWVEGQDPDCKVTSTSVQDTIGLTLNIFE